MSGCSTVGQQPSKGFAKTMWPAIQRQSSRVHRNSHPPAEAIDSEWLSVLCSQNANVLARQRTQRVLAAQIRAARGLLGWSQSYLAEASRDIPRGQYGTPRGAL